MRILIANDDGIQSEGLKIMVAFAKTLGSVTVVAPKTEQSGKSHSIELHAPIEAKKVDFIPNVDAYSVDSTPADCIRFAVLGLKEKFDIVFSGVNCGTNIGSDIAYSGTVSVVYEANLWDIPAIAFSTDSKAMHVIAKELPAVWDFVCRNQLLDKHNMYNINIPLSPRGIWITKQGGHYTSDLFEPIGNDRYLAKGINLYQQAHDYTIDTNAFCNGYTSITPLSTQRTQLDVFEALKGLNG